MSYKRKCFVGSSFHSFNDLLEWIDLNYWIFLGGKAIHPSFVQNRSLISVRTMQKSGYIKQCFDAYGGPYITDSHIDLEDMPKFRSMNFFKLE